MTRRIAQLLVVPGLAGCIGGSDPDTVVTFRVIDHLGAALPAAVISCSYHERVGDDAIQVVDGVVANLGTSVDYTCTVPAEAERVISLEAETADAFAERWLDSTLSDVPDLVVWRPAVTAELVGDQVAVSWGPSPAPPEPGWTPRMTMIGPAMFGGRDLDPSATSYTFLLEDLEDGDRTLGLSAGFAQPSSPAIESLHIARFEAPPAAPIVPRSRDAACQLVHRFESEYGDGYLDELVDFPAGSCPLVDGSLVWVSCYEVGAPCDVVEGTIDLGAVVPVRRVRIHGETEWDDHTISISEDGVSFTALDAYDPLPAPASARYVRVSTEDDLFEISVF